jgi:polygalacturonase
MNITTLKKALLTTATLLLVPAATFTMKSRAAVHGAAADDSTKLSLAKCLPPAQPGHPSETVIVEAPFPMKPIEIFAFPQQDFPVTDYGAAEGGEADNTQAIAKAINACHQAGGGRVIIPAGVWLTGAIHFRSNVNLHLQENAVLRFTDNPSGYLPAVMTSWEGMECFNYSPLLYAFECKNIAITGKGTLSPRMDTWQKWFARPKPHLDALKKLYTMASTDVPVAQRQMAEGENNLRPHLIHFNRCENVLLDGFTIRESPFWTIHLYMCSSGVVRNLDVKAHGHNNDGIDFEMSRNFLVERCIFDQGDDAVVIKSGRNRDAWRLNTPCENIVIRSCTILNGHTLLGIGSEISGGVRNIYMHDCAAPRSVHRFFFIKTNHRRGGFVENIYMENVKSGSTQRVLEIDTEVLYQWKDLVPTYEERITRIDGIHLKNVTCETADAIYELKGDAKLPVKKVKIKNVHVGTVRQFVKKVANVENVEEENVTYTSIAGNTAETEREILDIVG